MERTPTVVASLLMIAGAFAGCIGSAERAPLGLLDETRVPKLLAVDATRPLAEQAVVWEGRTLRVDDGGRSGMSLVEAYSCWVTGTCPWYDEPTCGEANCDRIEFDLALPAGFWETHEGALDVTLRYLFDEEDEDWAGFDVTVFDANGKEVAEGWSGGEGTVALVPNAPPGRYVIEIVASWGTEAAYAASIQVDAAAKDGPVRELLPNLVTLPPRDLSLASVSGRYLACLVVACVPNPAGSAAESALGVQGCYEDEMVEEGARRCLRFANRVGNVGEGPLEVRLSTVEAAKAFGAMGQHVQRVYRSDGSFSDRAAGGAHFHPSHEHFHYLDLVEFRLHTFDLTTDTRGELVNEEAKSGICLVDVGIVRLALPHTSEPNWDVTCFYATFSDENAEWFMSLSPNWFDLYGSGTTENYVDVSGVPDGVYELVSTTNSDGSVQESTDQDNEGSVVFRLTGDEVEILKDAQGAEWMLPPAS